MSEGMLFWLWVGGFGGLEDVTDEEDFWVGFRGIV